MTKKLDLIGYTSGNLQVIEQLDERYKDGTRYWKCKCVDCGKETKRLTTNITRKNNIPMTCECKRVLKQGESSFLKLYRQYKNQASIRGHCFELSLEWFKELTSSNCSYCGVAPFCKFEGTRTNGPYIYNGLDRKHNYKGYELDNVVPCCKLCNKAKADMTILEWDLWIDRLLKHRVERK